MQRCETNSPTHNQTNNKTQPNPKKQQENQPKKKCIPNSHNHTKTKMIKTKQGRVPDRKNKENPPINQHATQKNVRLAQKII
jgi:hypothetical protein